MKPTRTAAVDIGGGTIKLAVIDRGRTLIPRSITAGAEGSLGARLPEIESGLRELSAGGDPPDGIAFAFPGIVDALRNRVLTTPGKFPDAPGLDLGGWAKAAFAVPFLMENDANAALFGECSSGCAAGSGDAVLCILGTGIGTAAMVGGRLLHGRHWQAGILGGHFKLADPARRCVCGGSGCLEAEVGSWALPARAAAAPGFAGSALAGLPRIDYESLFACCRAGDTLSLGLLASSIEGWARGLATLVHAYDPEIVILAGAVMRGRDLVAERLEERTRELAWTPWGRIGFRWPAEPGNSVLLGLHALMEERLR